MTATGTAPHPFVLPDQPSELDLVARYFKVLAEPTRTRILELLRGGAELSVRELMDRLGLAQSNVSNHLACLRWCGFVLTRREHRTVYYRLADGRVSGVIDLARELLHGNKEHVAICHHVGSGGC